MSNDDGAIDDANRGMDDDDRILRRLLDLEHRLKGLDEEGRLDTTNIEQYLRRRLNEQYADIEELQKLMLKTGEVINSLKSDIRNVDRLQKEYNKIKSGASLEQVEETWSGLKWWSENADARFRDQRDLLLRETTAMGMLIGELSAAHQKHASRVKWGMILLMIITGISLLEIIKIRNGVH